MSVIRSVEALATYPSERAKASVDWEWAYAQHAPSLIRYLTRLAGDRDSAADLTQDTFIRAMHADTSNLRDLRPWLYRIATNLALQRLRRRRLVQFLPFSGSEVATDEFATDEVRQVRRALQMIPGEQAAALVLMYHEGYHRGEIASMLEVPEETIKTRLARGRRSFAVAFASLQTERG